MGISLDKVQQKAPELVSLAKNAGVSLSKRNLTNQKAKVALVLDHSGSMSRDYKSGSMQRLAEKVLALGSQLDDDGAIELFVFDSTAAYLGDVTLDNYKGSVDRLRAGRHMGTTDYAAAFKLLTNHYGFSSVYGEEKKSGFFGKKTVSAPGPLSAPAQEPVLAVFLTDGAPNNAREAITELTNASYAPIFWQFLSIGREPIDFLQKLDDLDGRYIDNADYKPVGDVDTISDNALFDLLLDEYPGWLNEERRRGQIV